MTTQLRFCPVGTTVKLADSLPLPPGMGYPADRLYTDKTLTVAHPGRSWVDNSTQGPPVYAAVTDEDGRAYRLHPETLAHPVCAERPPLRARCALKGQPLAFGAIGHIDYLRFERGVLKAFVWFPTGQHGASYPAAFLEWWAAPCDETHGGGRPLPARPKNWKEYANVTA